MSYLACGLFLPPWLVPHRRRLFLLGVLLVFFTACVMSCASSSGGTGGGPAGRANGANTPPRTNTIPVTITSTRISHSLNVTLTVD